MPQTKLQTFFFMVITVLISVIAFTIYNTAIYAEEITNRIFINAAREIPVEFVFALGIQALIAYKLARKMAFRFVDPEKDKPIIIILAITTMTVCLMCPSMSLVATILYDGFSPEFLLLWLKKVTINFPFAFFTQIFFIGPFVRYLFRNVFRT